MLTTVSFSQGTGGIFVTDFEKNCGGSVDKKKRIRYNENNIIMMGEFGISFLKYHFRCFFLLSFFLLQVQRGLHKAQFRKGDRIYER